MGGLDVDEETLRRIHALVEAEPLDLSQDRTRGRLSRLCAALDRAVPASGAGMTMAVEGAPGLVLAASGPWTEQLEELQITLGEGPCVDTVARRRPVLEPDLAGSGARAWPAYAIEAQSLGVEAVFAVPLQIGGACLGGLDVYRTRPGSLTRAALSDVLAFAEVAFGILLDGEERLERDAEEHVDDGEGPGEWTGSSVLYQAQGMVMVQLGVQLAEAMSRIRAHAFSHDRRLGSVARDILSGKLMLKNGDP